MNAIFGDGKARGIPKVSQDGLLVAIFLAFLATAGLFYVNLGGAFLSAFVDGLGISRESAGYITSANKYGAAFGALLATFVVKHIPWRLSAYLTIIALISVDVLSFSISNPTTLIVVRFIHGTIGGGLVGLGFSIIARTKSPDRIFGMLVAIQYTFGSIGIFTVPKLVGTFGPGAAFGALITFSTITFLMVPFIPDYETKKVHQTDQNNNSKKIILAPAALGLLALFFFQSSKPTCLQCFKINLFHYFLAIKQGKPYISTQRNIFVKFNDLFVTVRTIVNFREKTF